MRPEREKKFEYRQNFYSVTNRITVYSDKPEEVEVHSTLLGYPIRFTLNDDLREFLKTL